MNETENEDVLVQAFEQGVRTALNLGPEPGVLKEDEAIVRAYTNGQRAGEALLGPFERDAEVAVAWLAWAAPLERCGEELRTAAWKKLARAAERDLKCKNGAVLAKAQLAHSRVYVGNNGRPEPDTAQGRLEWELALTLAFQPQGALAVVCIAPPSGDLLFAVQRNGVGFTGAISRGVLAIEDPVLAIVTLSAELMAKGMQSPVFKGVNPEVFAALCVQAGLDARAKAPPGPCPRCNNRGVVVDDTAQVRREVPCLNGCLAPRVHLVHAGQA